MQDLHEMPVQWFERVWNQKDENAIDELLSVDCLGYGLGPVFKGPADFKVFYRKFRAAFPDLHVKTEKVIAEGDWTVLRFTATGTHQGHFDDLAPTNNKFSVDGMVMTRWQNGQIVEAFNSVDMLGLLTQIGAVPSGA